MPTQSYLDWVSVIVPGQPCTLYEDFAELIVREFSVEARIVERVRRHKKRAHLRKYQRDRLAGWLRLEDAA